MDAGRFGLGGGVIGKNQLETCLGGEGLQGFAALSGGMLNSCVAPAMATADQRLPAAIAAPPSSRRRTPLALPELYFAMPAPVMFGAVQTLTNEAAISAIPQRLISKVSS